MTSCDIRGQTISGRVRQGHCARGSVQGTRRVTLGAPIAVTNHFATSTYKIIVGSTSSLHELSHIRFLIRVNFIGIFYIGIGLSLELEAYFDEHFIVNR